MEIERDEMEVGVLFVGAGPATLSGAIRLMDLIEDYNEKVESGEVEGEAIDVEELPIMVIEKGAQIGDQILSGAVVDPRAMFELFDDEFLTENPPPFNAECREDDLRILAPPVEQLEADESFKGKVLRLCDKLASPLMDRRSISSPILPLPFHNEGNYTASLSDVVKWMAEVAEEKGVMIMPEFPGADLLIEDGRVVGVRTGDKGIDKNGEPRGNFEPGTDIKARLVILGEGARGSLTKLAMKKYGLAEESNHQIYSTGVKELWKVPEGRISPGEVYHTAGYPLDGDTFGGGWIYGLNENHVSIGLVTALDSPDPYLDPHRKFNEWKDHPFLKSILDGGEMLKYGAKTIPEGGWFSLPQPYMPGALLIGDSAGFVNISRLKGIHLSMKSGMLAGETAFDILKAEPETGEDTTLEATYWHRILGSWIMEELWQVRNFRQGFQRRLLGVLPGMITGTLYAGSGFMLAGLLAVVGLLFVIGCGTLIPANLPLALFAFAAAMVTFASSMPLGNLPIGRLDVLADHERMRKIDIGGWSRETKDSDPVPGWRLPGISAAADQVRYNAEHPVEPMPARPLDEHAPAMSVTGGGVMFDKVTSVYHSGSTHEEDQPAHLVVADQDICHTRCAEEYGNPCQYFCPASVYEMVETEDGKGRKLMLNFSNCVHCKTCDIRDPYQIITWVPPEGGGGPSYAGL